MMACVDGSAMGRMAAYRSAAGCVQTAVCCGGGGGDVASEEVDVDLLLGLVSGTDLGAARVGLMGQG